MGEKCDCELEECPQCQRKNLKILDGDGWIGVYCVDCLWQIHVHKPHSEGEKP